MSRSWRPVERAVRGDLSNEPFGVSLSNEPFVVSLSNEPFVVSLRMSRSW
jgi:hypothetical protein